MARASKKRQAVRPVSFPVRLAQLHGRLLVSIALGVAVMLALLGFTWRLPTKLLLSWDAGVILYLALTFVMMARSDIAQIRRRAAAQDEGAFALLVLCGIAALASLAAIVAELGKTSQADLTDAIELGIGMGTIVFSWLFMHTIFALHYAHEYYGDGRDGDIGGLRFPGSAAPDYWDFIYFSFVVAMTSQVSDVAVTSRTVRRVVNIHGILAFLFNFSVLALMVNMVSSLLRPGG